MPYLDWLGKDKVINHHIDVPFHTLKPVSSYGDTEAAGENLIIHGDNLLALKALLPQYEGKIKLIYIDPPYNTGNENWVYNDNVNDQKIKKWLGQVVGKEGEDLSRHDKWLCMMYPRLKILHKLLRDDGAIFISIDDNEQANLKLICDEIFGGGNFVGQLTWESTTQPINSGSARFGLQKKVEPILFYAKRKHGLNTFMLKELDSELKYPHDGKLGKCRFEIIEKSDAGAYKRDTMKFKILGQYPRGGKRWQIGEETAIELEKTNRLEIIDNIVKKAVYPEDELAKRKFVPFWSHLTSNQVGTAQSAKDLLNEIFDKALGFDTVKPPQLLEELFCHFPENSIILDSFAGSGTTAHAVLKLNKEDGGNRHFILIETEDYANSITAERVRRVIDGYGTGDKKVEGTGGGFTYCDLGEAIFTADGELNPNVKIASFRQYIWYAETKSALPKTTIKHEYFLGSLHGVSYYFYYKKSEKTILDFEFLKTILHRDDQYVIYADTCVLDSDFLKEHNIKFKKIPRDILRY